MDKPVDKPVDKMAKARAARGKPKAAPAPAPAPEPEAEPEPFGEVDPAEIVKLRQKTLEELQTAYANGHHKEVLELLSALRQRREVVPRAAAGSVRPDPRGHRPWGSDHQGPT